MTDKKKIRDFVPQVKNPNLHNTFGMRLLEKSIQNDGWIGAQTAAKDGEIIAGSARQEIAIEKFTDKDGKEVEPIIVESDGSRPVIIVRTDIENADTARARRLSAAENQIAKSNYNPDFELLKEWGGEDEQIKKLFSDDEWREGTGEEKPQVDAEPQIDRAAELAEKWKTSTNQLWKLGEHRLLIGDCTVRENVDRLMDGERADMTFIDPPYNALKSWNKDEAHSETRLDPSAWFENDNMEWSEYWEFMARMFENLQGHSAYICCDFRIYDGLKPLIEASGYKVKHCIVWKKNVWGLGKRYRFQHEFIIYACKEKAPFYGDRSQSDVWEMDIKKTTEHNTPKPVELPQKAISNSLENGAIMFDGCCGHGTTIIAAHNLSRRCYAMEISEKYGAVILERFFTATGITPELVG